MRIYYISLFTSLFLLFTSCISFDLSSLKDKTAKGVVFIPPPPPYKKWAKKSVDAFWKAPKNGNILSFFSNCSSTAPFASLEQFQKDILEDLKRFRVIYRDKTHHQGQKARYLKLSQLGAENLKITVELFLFKKESCFYALSFLSHGTKNPLSFKTLVFKNFIQEFRAP